MIRILVVDDCKLTHEVLEAALGLNGYELAHAFNWVGGLKLAFRTNPDLVLVDLGDDVEDDSDAINGFEFIQSLRQDSRFEKTPIVALSSTSEVSCKLKTFEAGADDFVTKPFNCDELSARISCLLRRTKTEAVGELDSGGKVICVHSLRGGIGCSSVAINTATILHELWQSRTLLLDANPWAGQVGLMLNGDAKRTWAELVDTDENAIDAELAKNLLIRHESGLDYLAAPLSCDPTNEVAATRLRRVVEVLTPTYDYIIVDTAHDLGNSTREILGLADCIVNLLAAELAAIYATSSTLHAFRSMGMDESSLVILLNQTTSDYGLSDSAVENTIGRPCDFRIPYRPNEFINAINVGEPIVVASEKSEVTRRIEDLCLFLSKDTHIRVPPAVPTKTWRRIKERLDKSGYPHLLHGAGTQLERKSKLMNFLGKMIAP